MMIEQYRPATPDAGNALHELQIMRIEAGREAREGWIRLKRSAQCLVTPSHPQHKPKTLVGVLLSNAQTIATGAIIGLRVVKALRGLGRRLS